MPLRHEQVFVCSTCGQSITVNDPMAATILEEGCVVCGAPVEARDFRGVVSPE
ncbi:MAG: DUF7560 family zinc ribbon protein [Halobacteriota archaeon]